MQQRHKQKINEKKNKKKKTDEQYKDLKIDKTLNAV